MKNVVIFIFAIASLNAFSADLDCNKAGSKITMDRKNVSIESPAVMTAELLDMVGRTTGMTAGSIKVNVKITFPKKNLKCSDALPKVFNCSGATKKAFVEMTIAQQSNFGTSGVTLSKRPVKIENIEISSSVGSQGPVVLGDNATTVNLDQVSVKTAMFVRMNGDFNLELSQSFNNGSECK